VMEVPFSNKGSALWGEWSPNKVQVVEHWAWANLKPQGFTGGVQIRSGFSSLDHCQLNVWRSGRGEWWWKRSWSVEWGWDWLWGEETRDGNFGSGGSGMRGGRRFIGHVEGEGRHWVKRNGDDICREMLIAFMLSRGCLRWYALMRSDTCMCSGATHLLLLSGKPFHLIRYWSFLFFLYCQWLIIFLISCSSSLSTKSGGGQEKSGPWLAVSR
jgi:hypothetical protein